MELRENLILLNKQYQGNQLYERVSQLINKLSINELTNLRSDDSCKDCIQGTLEYMFSKQSIQEGIAGGFTSTLSILSLIAGAGLFGFLAIPVVIGVSVVSGIAGGIASYYSSKKSIDKLY